MMGVQNSQGLAFSDTDLYMIIMFAVVDKGLLL